jgi:ubiquinone/menaquinone biosynthesis C-methylase UbiE
MGREPTTERVRRHFDAHAADYDQQMRFVERHLLGEHREWATSRASGAVLELAVGTGLNLPFYPAAATGVVGVELSEQMLTRARQRISLTGLSRCRVLQADVANLDWADGSFDTVVSTYALCTIPEPAAALREARRVLRDDGLLVLVEHGPARNRLILAGQRLLNPWWVRLQADDMLRDPVALAREAGFDVQEYERAGRAGLVYRIAARKAPARTAPAAG